MAVRIIRDFMWAKLKITGRLFPCCPATLRCARSLPIGSRAVASDGCSRSGCKGSTSIGKGLRLKERRRSLRCPATRSRGNAIGLADAVTRANEAPPEVEDIGVADLLADAEALDAAMAPLVRAIVADVEGAALAHPFDRWRDALDALLPASENVPRDAAWAAWERSAQAAPSLSAWGSRLPKRC